MYIGVLYIFTHALIGMGFLELLGIGGVMMSEVLLYSSIHT